MNQPTRIEFLLSARAARTRVVPVCSNRNEHENLGTTCGAGVGQEAIPSSPQWPREIGAANHPTSLTPATAFGPREEHVIPKNQA